MALILTLCIGGRLAIRAMNAAADAPPAPPPVPAPVVPIADSPLPVVAAKAPIFAVGQCLSMINAAALAPRSSILACGYQHVGEVFAVIPVDGANYTGIDELFALRDECSASLTAYADPAKIEGDDRLHPVADGRELAAWRSHGLLRRRRRRRRPDDRIGQEEEVLTDPAWAQPSSRSRLMLQIPRP